MTILKDRIRELRKSVGLTQAEFGARIGVKGNTVTGYETGLRVPSDAVILSICREFNANPQWIQTGDGPMLIERSRSDELAAFFGSLSRDPDGSFRAALISELAQLDLESWQALEAFCRRVLDRDGKKKED